MGDGGYEGEGCERRKERKKQKGEGITNLSYRRSSIPLRLISDGVLG